MVTRRRVHELVEELPDSVLMEVAAALIGVGGAQPLRELLDELDMPPEVRPVLSIPIRRHDD